MQTGISMNAEITQFYEVLKIIAAGNAYLNVSFFIKTLKTHLLKQLDKCPIFSSTTLSLHEKKRKVRSMFFTNPDYKDR